MSKMKNINKLSLKLCYNVDDIINKIINSITFIEDIDEFYEIHTNININMYYHKKSGDIGFDLTKFYRHFDEPSSDYTRDATAYLLHYIIEDFIAKI